MSYDWLTIQSVMAARRRADASTIRRMVETKEHVNGDVTVPLVDVQGQPELNQLMPFMVADGIEAISMRAAGTMPTVHVPALDPMKREGVRSEAYAAIRRRALYAAWDRSFLPLILGRGYRQLTAYGTCALVVVPDFEREHAVLQIRDALGAYPEQRAPEDIREPENVGFVFGRSPSWITSRYPEALDVIGDWQTKHPTEELWDLVEWSDAEHIVVGILGPRSLYQTNSSETMAQAGMELRRWPNRAGMCTAIVPRRVTLDRIAGQLEKIIPMEEWAARLMALDVSSVEKGVFPDLVVIGEDGRTPQILNSGGWQDGRTGNANLLQGVKAVQYLQTAPGPMTNPMLDRIERNARVSGGISPFFGGETTGSLRTGRAIDSLGGFSIDPRVQEIQTIMGYALQAANRGILLTEKGYWGAKKYVTFSGWPTDRAHVEYTPNTHFESTEQTVSYSFPGSDASQVTVAVAQLTAAKLISRQTARSKHPYIEDADQEDRLVIQESIDEAMLVAWQEQIANGSIGWEAIARYRELIKGGEHWPDAILKVQREAQERQAQQQAALAQGQAGPEVQPGLDLPPGGIPTVPPPVQGQLNLAQMVRAVAAPPAAARKNPMPVAGR